MHWSCRSFVPVSCPCQDVLAGRSFDIRASEQPPAVRTRVKSLNLARNRRQPECLRRRADQSCRSGEIEPRFASVGSRTDRGSLRLGQDHRRVAQTQASGASQGGLSVHPHLRCLQLGAAAHPGRRHMSMLLVDSYPCAAVAGVETPAKNACPNPSKVVFPSQHSLHHSQILTSARFSTAS